MERRSFLAGLIAAPFATLAAKFGFGKTLTPAACGTPVVQHFVYSDDPVGDNTQGRI